MVTDRYYLISVPIQTYSEIKRFLLKTIIRLVFFKIAYKYSRYTT